MPQRPYVRIETLQRRWQQSPFHGGLLGIALVALATAVIGAACAVIALIATLVY